MIREVIRVLRVGGQALFYAWAYEQKKDQTKSGHKFAAQDVLVPWHLKPARETPKAAHAKADGGTAASSGEASQNNDASASSTPTQQRVTTAQASSDTLNTMLCGLKVRVTAAKDRADTLATGAGLPSLARQSKSEACAADMSTNTSTENGPDPEVPEEMVYQRSAGACMSVVIRDHVCRDKLREIPCMVWHGRDM